VSCGRATMVRATGAAGAVAALALLPPVLEAQPSARSSSDGTRIEVSLDERKLWLIEGSDTVLSATVAIGRDERVVLQGREYNFRTPRGTRRVLKKERDPVWVPPDWHYYEKAEVLELEPVKLAAGRRYELEDGSHLEIRGDDVGRVNRYGNFTPFEPGWEIIFDGRIYIPPFGTRQRRVPDALGPFKIDLGDGYLIHGTHMYNSDSIGEAASHGCVRMDDDDLALLYERVRPGMPVVIY
jgi:hypothetical protein